MPKPKKNESKQDYIARCMSDKEMIAKHKKGNERYAVCINIYKNEK